MLAVFVSVLVGIYFYMEAGLWPGVLSGLGGFIAFAIFGYVRAAMWARDPVKRLSLAATGTPGGNVGAERFIAAIIIPAVVGYGLGSYLTA